MSDILTYILFVVGFTLLMKGADILVDGASSLAKRMHVSNLIVGLTIVAFGTSTPEFFVNIFASIDGNAGIGIGNIFGSNIANVLLVLGVASIIYPLPVQRNTVLSEIPFSLTAVILVGFVANTVIFFDTSSYTKSIYQSLYISRLDGIFLLLFFFLFLGYIFKITNEQSYQEKIDDIMGKKHEESEPEMKIFSLTKSTIYIIVGITALFVGGQWVVDGAVLISKSFGLSDSFIGLTIIAVGTSLPELVTSATAAYKKNTDIAVGNVVGSNIFNLLWILGISAIIKPMPFDVISNIDIMVVILSSAMLLFAMTLGKKYVLERWNGIIFLVVYIAYIVFLIDRG
ncbi:MAG: calcium/sodium antiporter [bacterium]